MDYLPKDPAILVSSVRSALPLGSSKNMLLRDEEFDTLESLCYAFNREPKEIKDYLMKSPKKRNFEADILTDDPEMLEAAIEQFDNVWIGKFFASSSINAARTVAVEIIVQTR